MKTLAGKVVSVKMNNTIVVEVGRQNVHPLYKKIMHRTKRFKVHSEKKDIKIGDMVKIVECKPLSKEKHHKIA